jgi:O-antigen ligase
MVNTKTLNPGNIFSLNSVFLFLFLILFPFGQIIRIGIVQPIDVVAGLAALYSVIKKLPKPAVFSYLNEFLLIALVSWAFSITIFPQITVLYGLLYLARLGSYIYFLIYVWNFAKSGKNRALLVDSLLSLAVISSAFGWIQLMTFPDLKPFFVWGWDIHLLRLVGTFLDPTFLGLIIVFGTLIAINKIMLKFSWKNVLLLIFLVISLAFTYSRASYLAFLAGVFVIFSYKKMFKQFLLLAAGLMILVLALPTAKNQSIEVFRQFSAVARIQNYQTTIKVFEKSPVFGVGYDNMCIAYRKFIGYQDFSSHACSGSDSSMLFILATTGISGILIFVYSILQITKSLAKGPYKIIIIASFIALIVHSTFSNSLVYPWILGWMIILLAVAV